MTFTETQSIKRPLVHHEMGATRRPSLSKEIDAINAQAAKIEVIVKEFKPILGSHFWTKEMIQGLDQALLSVGITIKPIQEGPTKAPLHSKGFEEIHIASFKKSEGFSTLLSILPEEEDDLASEILVEAKKAVITQKIHEEVAKISVMIQDYLGASQDPRLSKDILLSLNYSLQLSGHQLARSKISSQDLFMVLADQTEDIPKLLETIEVLLDELTNSENNETEISPLETLDIKSYSENVIEYVKCLTERTNSLLEIKAQINSDHSYFIEISKKRAEKENELILVLEEAILELEFNRSLLDTERPNEHLLTSSQEPLEKAIDASSKNGLFNMQAFSLQYSQKNNPNIFRYIKAISSLVGTRNLNSEQMKNQMRKHFEKIQLKAKEKDREVRALREKSKEVKVRLERRRENDKRLTSKEGAKTAAAAATEKGLFTKWLNTLLKPANPQTAETPL